MNVNMEPFGLPNVRPTARQRWTGHAVVGLTVATTVHLTTKPHPVVSLVVGSFAAYLHKEMDAPVSQVIAAIAA